MNNDYDPNADPTKTLINYNQLIKNIPEDWRKTQGADIKIAILDTGFYLNHPDLKNRIKAENVYNAVNFSQDVSGNEEHGTCIAGLIGAKSDNSKSGIIGLAPSSIMGLVKIYDENDVIQPAYLIEGLRWSIDVFKANIINMSFNPSLENDSINNIIQKIKEAEVENIALMAAAGDEADLLKKFQEYAATLTTLIQDNIISVGAVSNDFLNKYSENDLNDYVEFMLPYIGLYSCSNNTSKYIPTPPGCSLSTAIISGLISIIKSYKGKKISIDEIKTSLKSVAKQYSSNYPQWGKNAFDAIFRNKKDINNV